MGSRIAVALVLFAAALLPSCKDDDQPPPDSAVVGDDSGIDGPTCAGTIAYLQACTANDDCTSCLCKSFGHSMVCTKSCGGDGDCPAPSGGCTAGTCRP
ncbi:MAG: hypothetical protein H0X17_08185 [Deltaproteobacteria bacterium]|nr:hypothetical protein [Deltaproteobacteria bacterium]